VLHSDLLSLVVHQRWITFFVVAFLESVSPMNSDGYEKSLIIAEYGLSSFDEF
jgi:hypothetical protein